MMKANSAIAIFEGKRVLCLCDTPFQAMGLLCMFSAAQNRNYLECDVLINPSFVDARQVALRLSDTGLFSTVWCNKHPYELTVGHLGMRWMLQRGFRERARDELFENCEELVGRKYDVLVCSCVSRLSLAARYWCVPEGYTVFFDDGSGSHNGNVFKPFACLDDVNNPRVLNESNREKAKRLAKGIARGIPLGLRPFYIRALFIFAPVAEDCQLYRNMDILPLLIPDDTVLLKDVLSPGLSAERYARLKWIFLTTSDTTPDEILMAEAGMADKLWHLLGDGYAIRLHPHRGMTDFEDCAECVLPSGDSWELLLASGAITEDHVLIGRLSSGQLHPKTLFGMEPRIVVLNNCLPAATEWDDAAMTQSIEDIRSRYVHKDRVVVPTSFEELIRFLTALPHAENNR